MMHDLLQKNLRALAQQTYLTGQADCRIAAMRMLGKLGLHAESIAISAMHVDDWLTPDEIAKRDKMT